MLAFATSTLLVPVCATFKMSCAVLLTCFSTVKTNHSCSSTSNSSSITSSTTDGVASDGPVDVLITPCGTGVIVTTFPHRWDCVIGLPRCAVRRLLRKGLMVDAITS